MSVGDLFADAQRSAHSHKSLARRLRKLEAKYVKNNRANDFEDHVKACILRLFEVAKTEATGNKIIRFLSTYFGTDLPNEKPNTSKKRRNRKPEDDGADDRDSAMGDAVDEDNDANFQERSNDEQKNAVANAILVSLLPYLGAKDKIVRYRAIQLISTIMASLNVIEDDLYKVVRHELMKRLRDKVPAIRLEAVLVLAPLVEGEIENAEATKLERDEREEDDSDYDEESTQASGLMEKLLDVLCNDTNADVRKALLVNLPISSDTLPYLLERARDKDAATRRAFYLKVCLQRLGDFRHLSVSMREKILRWGLRDRDERVRKATARMFREKWIEDCAKSQPSVEGDQEDMKKTKQVDGLREPSLPALLELLERIDVMNSGGEGGAAIEAMKEFWTGRPDYVEEPLFDDTFWQDLTPESAFMARTWNDFCQSSTEFYELIENRMPEVTRLGFHIQHHMNDLTSKLEANQRLEDGAEEDTVEQEFIVEQLLRIAHTLDYTDEIGRRKMFGLFRNAITIPNFPDECTRLAVEALRLTCTADAAGEREFTSVILEAISEVHDSINDANTEQFEGGEAGEAGAEDDSFASAQSSQSQKSDGTETGKSKFIQPSEEEQIRSILITLKCLNIAHAMLQNVSSSIKSNHYLENLLNSLILPCCRSHDAPVRERGLECLGLCCLLEPNMAKENWPVFVHCLKRGDDNLKVLAVQLLCDLLLTSSRKSVVEAQNPSDAQPTLELDLSPFTRAFEYAPEVQSAATTSLGKLMLCGFYKGEATELFDDAVVEAETRSIKGWELLGKVRIAVQVNDNNTKNAVTSVQAPSAPSRASSPTKKRPSKRTSSGNDDDDDDV